MVFVDDALDDPDALSGIDDVLQAIARGGADVRRAWLAATEVLDRLSPSGRPRAVVTTGPEARTLRTVLEPTSPVPVLAWTHGTHGTHGPHGTLPGWTGPLDLVVLLCGSTPADELLAVAAEARRRGCEIIVCAPPESPLVETAGHGALVVPAGHEDTSALGVVVLEALHRLALGPVVEPEHVADTLDAVAVRCGPRVHTDENPAKQLAVALAEDIPLVWGRTTLAAQAAIRVAEMLRRATGRPAIAGTVEQLRPVLEHAPERDLFADPIESGGGSARPAVVLLDDDSGGGASVEAGHAGDQLQTMAEQAALRMVTVEADGGSEVARLASLFAQGRYVAAYLALGLGGYRGETGLGSWP